jgi:hypothetical protein
MNGVLVIYNTCGLSGRDNVAHYVRCMANLLNQDCPKFHLVLSDCCTSGRSREKILAHFKDTISYNFIDDVLPLNVTVNSTIGMCVDHFGEFDSYLYVDSGIDVRNNRGVVREMSRYLRSDPTYGMAAAQVNDDSGYGWWNVDPQQAIIPVGKTVNLHCQVYSSEYYRAYGRLLPDIFASDTHESIYTFLTAAVNLQFAIHPTLMLSHVQGIDGPSTGFIRGQSLFATSKSIGQICAEGHPLGFGYEEYANVCMHDQSLYKDNVTLLNPEPLHKFLLANVFLSKSEFDYNNIKQYFIPSSVITAAML